MVITWSGAAIDGERPDYFPSGSAEFTISGSTLTIVLTDTTTQQTLSIGEILTGLVWDIAGTGVSLDPLAALIAPGSRLAGVGATSDTDLSGEWGYRGDLSAGIGGMGPLGSYGISSVGDVNNGVDSFGPGDRFNTASNLFPPPSGSLNGVEGGIVGANVDFTSDGFKTQGPVVQGWDGSSTQPGQMIFTFQITGTLNEAMIYNVQPIYGSDGATLVAPPFEAPVVPEPASVVIWTLLGTLAIGSTWRRARHK